MTEDEKVIVGMDLGLRSLVTLSTGEKYGGDVYEFTRRCMEEGGKAVGLWKCVVRAKMKTVPWWKFRKIIVENPPCDEEGCAFVAGGRGALNEFRYPLGYIKDQVKRYAREHDIVLVWLPPKGWSRVCLKCGERVYDYSKTREHRCPKCKLRMDRDTFSALKTLLFYYGIEKCALDELMRGYFVDDEEGVEWRHRNMEALGLKFASPEQREASKRAELEYLERDNKMKELAWS